MSAPTLKELLARKNASRRVGGGTATSEPPRERMPIKDATLDALPRELQSQERGENLPDEWPGNGTADYQWKEAYSSFASDLAIVIEPSPSPYAWLAVARKDGPGRPILLARLPLAGRFPGAGADIPF